MNEESINLIEASQSRMKYLSDWRRERAIERLLDAAPGIDIRVVYSDVDANESGADGSGPGGGGAGGSPVIGHELEDHSDSAADALLFKAVFGVVKAGEVYLLPEGSTLEPSFSYVAVLSRDIGSGTALCAPFSPYSAPAYKDEWLTGLEARPLRVLQLWNVHPVPVSWLARGWRVGALSAQQLAEARELYDCALSGRWADFPLREATGLAIHDPQDDRLLYQEEQLELYAPLRWKLFEHVERLESRYIPASIPELELRAADAGDVVVQVSLLAPDGSAKAALKAEMMSDTSSAYWRILGWDEAVPGTPVSAYAGKPEDGAEPLATTCTTGNDGCQIDLEEAADKSDELRAALDAGKVWFVIREVD